MDLAEAMLARLNAAPAVTAIVQTAIHWGLRPQKGPLPAIVMRQVGRTQDDPLEGEADIRESRVQLDALAGTHAQAWALAKAARAALTDEAEVGGFLFWNSDADGPIDLSEDTAAGILHRASTDFVMRHGADV